MTTTPWAHLPNAVHIDRVIAIANVSPHCRAVGWDKGWSVAQEKAWNIAWWLAQEEGKWDTMRDKQQSLEWGARQAMLALCVYDECAYMLDSDPGELAILAAFGDPRAVLLLSACKTFHSLKEI